MAINIGDKVRLKNIAGEFIVTDIIDGIRYEVVRNTGGNATNPNDPNNIFIVGVDNISSHNEIPFKVYYRSTYDSYRQMINDAQQSLDKDSLQALNWTKEHSDKKIQEESIKYGNLVPAPRNTEDALSRTKFLRMDLYRQFKDEILQPFMEQLRFASQADLEKQRLKINDRESGAFDFARASVNLLPSFVYWSIKHDRVAESDEIKIEKQSNGKYEYTMIKDGTPVELRSKLDEGGNKEYYSTIKKCYVSKEKTIQPINAIRIFVSVGLNWTYDADSFLFTGFTAMGLNEMLTELGYMTSFIVCYGYHIITNNSIRAIFINMKNFNEQVYVENFLQPLADASFFRTRCFQDFITLQLKYNEFGNKKNKENAYVKGSPIDSEMVQQATFSTFAPKDIHKQCMYINVPNGLNSNNDVIAYLRETILNIENVNKILKEQANRE